MTREICFGIIQLIMTPEVSFAEKVWDRFNLNETDSGTDLLQVERPEVEEIELLKISSGGRIVLIDKNVAMKLDDGGRIRGSVLNLRKPLKVPMIIVPADSEADVHYDPQNREEYPSEFATTLISGRTGPEDIYLAAKYKISHSGVGPRDSKVKLIVCSTRPIDIVLLKRGLSIQSVDSYWQPKQQMQLNEIKPFRHQSRKGPRR